LRTERKKNTTQLFFTGVVAHEEVVRLRGPAADVEQFQQIIQLPVDVAANGHRRVHAYDVVLPRQELLRPIAQIKNRLLGRVLAVSEALDPRILLVVLVLQLLDERGVGHVAMQWVRPTGRISVRKTSRRG